MKYRLDEDHYDNDSMQLLPTGTVVGDGCDNPWRYPASSPNKALAGTPRPPSRAMTPVDDEAKREYAKHFNEGVPERDPTRAVPITPIDGKRDVAGNVRPASAASAPPNPSVKVPATGENVTKDDSVAKDKPGPGPGKA